MVTPIKIRTVDLSVAYENYQALKPLNMEVRQNEILGIIGPANSGKSTFLRCLNRLGELNPDFQRAGTAFIDGVDIYRDVEVEQLRRRVGMVFALPVALPMSIFDNVSYGLKRHGTKDARLLEEVAERTLKAAYLWDEVKDRLNASGLKLSGGQQQRLALARTLAVEPDILLYDEPCSGLDPISTAKIEEAMLSFKEKYTQVLVTNNTKQAARVSDRTAFFLMGELVELGPTAKIFTAPDNAKTNDYIAGRFG